MARRRNKGQISQPIPDVKSFDLKLRIVRSGRCGVAKPTEEFWTAWRESKGHLLRMGFKVTKEKDWVVEVPLEFCDEASTTPESPNEEIMRDDLEKGLFNTGAASNLRAETADEYDRRRDFEEDGDGSDYPSYSEF